VSHSFAPPIVIYLILHTGIFIYFHTDLTRITYRYMLSFPHHVSQIHRSNVPWVR
jgi:hypothetical protein